MGISVSAAKRREAQEYSLQDVCRLLSISTATAKNWIRLGKLTTKEDGSSFDKSYIDALYYRMKDGEDDRLKSRRNKKSVTGRVLYKDYIRNGVNQTVIQNILATHRNLSQQELRVILANFAVQLYYQSCDKDFRHTNVLSTYLEQGAAKETFYTLITDLLKKKIVEKSDTANIADLLEYRLSFVPGEDTLGFVYISLRDLGQRKSSGVYYTPSTTVSLMNEGIFECTDGTAKTFCDPCCGTGNFLIDLVRKGVSPDQIYGQDMDEISVQITRINLFLLCQQMTKDQLYSHFLCGNTLKDTFPEKFDVVLGNPPWGFEFSKEDVEYLVSRYVTAKAKGMESFELFVEKALSMLAPGGIMAYVLPEAILSVAAHAQARKLLIRDCSFSFISFLGNVFSGVQCPAILLGVTLACPGRVVGCKVTTKKDTFTIMEQRNLEKDVLTLHLSDEEMACLTDIASIENPAYLRGNARFGLGIVTGNNQAFITDKKKDGYETILKGCDILRYKCRQSDNYIQFVPQQFQQVAPEEMYRAPEKLLYRFISQVPVFAYDDGQTLSLNSCNILIPEIEGLHIKYILAILNSSVAAYYLSKKFHSVKLLRSHLENLPIPVVSREIQEKIVDRVDGIMNGGQGIREMYEELDLAVMDLYGLEKFHRKLIKEALQDHNMYLE